MVPAAELVAVAAEEQAEPTARGAVDGTCGA